MRTRAERPSARVSEGAACGAVKLQATSTSAFSGNALTWSM